MSFGIVRIQKMKSTAVRGIKIHDDREKEVSHTNPDIDRERTAENYAFQSSENWNADIKNRIESLDLAKTPRKDAVVMCQALVTSDYAFFEKLPSDQQKQFFQDAFEFVKLEYGAKNIISATVHTDEKTPHLHVNFVPITDDGRLSAKSLLTRESLRNLQTDFYKQVGQKYGLERGESREDKRKHLDTEKYKLKTGWDDLKRNKEALALENEEFIKENADRDTAPVREIKEEDLKCKVLEKGFFRSSRETPQGIALRLNNEHLKPLAQWAQQVPGLCQRLKETQKELSETRIQLQVYRENYTELVRDLSKDQIGKIEKDADEMRERNRERQKAEELARREAEMKAEIKKIQEAERATALKEQEIKNRIEANKAKKKTQGITR